MMNLLFLRDVKAEDMDLLFQWANEPLVRQNSFHTAPISYDSHVVWFQKMMKSKNVLQYILMDSDIPIGQIRLTVQDGIAEIGYSIASEYRGQGYGRQLLQLAMEKIKTEHPEIRKLTASVKPDNIASNLLFCHEGYVLDYHHYSLDLSV